MGGCLPPVGKRGLPPEGVCIGGGGGCWADPPSTTGYSQQAGDMHPTGIHTCL